MVHESSDRELTESLERVRRVERVAHLGLWEWDRRSEQVFWSEGMYRVFGQTPGGFVTVWENILDTFHPHDRPAIIETLERVLTTANSYSLVLRVFWEDGTMHWVQCEGEAVRDETGRVISLCGTAQDVTAHCAATEQVAASERMFRRLADSLPALIVYLDSQLRYQFVNHVWERWWEVQSEAVLGRTVQECLSVAAYRQIESRLNAALAGKPQEYELNSFFPGVGWRYIHLNYYPDFDADGSVAGVFVLVNDLSEQRRTEEALLRQAKALTEVDKRKDEFLAMLGHELRNPLTPIHNAAQILNQPVAREDTERVAWAARIITDQTDKLITLTDDLLDVARITRGQIRLRWERVDLREVIARATDAARESADANAQTLMADYPDFALWVEGDPVRLSQIVANLIRNAVKFTGRGGEIRISVGKEGDQAVIRVLDTGAGIAREFLPKIFDRFTRRSHYPGVEHEGLGLGLHLCRYLTERQGGTIQAYSEGVGLGSEFCVRFPLAAKPLEQLKVKDSDQPYELPPRCRVLIVDDNEAVADSMLVLLKAMGQEACAASDGVSALEAVDDFRPDIVFLDLGLPGMDGYEVARRLRQKYPKGDLLLVALTGYGQSSDQQDAEEAGFDCYLIKPASAEQLTDVLRAFDSCS